MPSMPTCFSHFLIFYIHCSQFGNRSKRRRRRAAVVIATVKWWTTKFKWNKKSWVVFVGFSFHFSFWSKTFHCFEKETRGWHCHSCILPPDLRPPQPSMERENHQSRMGESAWWHLILSPLLRFSFVFIQHSM